MNIREYIKRLNDIDNDLSRYRWSEDIVRIIKVMKDIDVNMSVKEAEMLWSIYSDDYCASWLGLPDNDEELKEIIIETAKAHFEELEGDK